MPLPAAIVAAVGIAMAAFLVPFIVYVATGGDAVWAVLVCGLIGVAAGTWFFVAWFRRAPKRRR